MGDDPVEYPGYSYKQYFAGLRQPHNNVVPQTDGLEIRRQISLSVSPFNCNKMLPLKDQGVAGCDAEQNVNNDVIMGTREVDNVLQSCDNRGTLKDPNVLKSAEVVPTVTSTTSVCMMPTTMISTTTISNTVMQTGFNHQMATSSFTNTTVLHLSNGGHVSTGGQNLLKDSDTNRKHHEENPESAENKRRNLGDEPGTLETAAVMQQMLSELYDIKTCVASIQEDNLEWKQKMGIMENDLKDVKESVEMAHNLVNDERKDRLAAEKHLGEEMVERKCEIANNM